MFVDTHTHLNFAAFKDDWREVADRAVEAGVEKMIVVGADLESSQRAVELAQEHAALYAAVGIHPHHARVGREIRNTIHSTSSGQEYEIRKLAKQPKVVAIGEIGLDYHVYKNSKYTVKDIDKQLQKELFEAQLQVAQEVDKPVIIHSREAGEEVLEIARGARGVFHCFGGSKKYLKKILAAGFCVGFTGQITYVPDRADVAREVPLDRLLIETDCPYMSPFKANLRSEPADVKIVGQLHAVERGIQLTEVEAVTTANAERLFGW